MPNSKQPQNCRKKKNYPATKNSQKTSTRNIKQSPSPKLDSFLPLLSSPVSSGGPQEERLERERAQLLVGGGGIRRDDAQREPIAEERELLEAEGPAGDGAVEGGGVAGDQLGGAVEGLRGGDVEVPEGRVHGRPQVRHSLGRRLERKLSVLCAAGVLLPLFLICERPACFVCFE